MREIDQGPIQTPRKISRRDAIAAGLGLVVGAGIGFGAAAATTRREQTSSPSASPLPDRRETEARDGTWQFASVDTMKTSRDAARTLSRESIGGEVRAIKDLGATHVAIGTPYDEEFQPVLREWVSQARQNGLGVWFRGNFCAFDRQYGTENEGWFGYPHEPDFTKQHEHVSNFITGHPDLFQHGDIFTPWPEPENVIEFYGNPQRYYDFLTTSYQTAQQAFQTIGKGNDVQINFSMNGDVARRLTPDVVRIIGNTVVMDHYVQDPAKMSEYIQAVIDLYGPEVNIILGEFGAGGNMSEHQQAEFVEQLLERIEQFPHNIRGVNYWVLVGGDTALYTDQGNPREVTSVIKSHYAAHT